MHHLLSANTNFGLCPGDRLQLVLAQSELEHRNSLGPTYNEFHLASLLLALGQCLNIIHD